LWKYPIGNEIKDLALWHENEAEYIPFCIMDELPYEKSEFEFITKEKYLEFENLYQNSNKIICNLIDSIASIGTQYLYGGQPSPFSLMNKKWVYTLYGIVSFRLTINYTWY